MTDESEDDSARDDPVRDDPIRRLAELETQNRALQRTQHLHRILLESIVDYAVLTLDTNLRVTSWNAGGPRVLGWTADAVNGNVQLDFEPGGVHLQVRFKRPAPSADPEPVGLTDR
jgi:PAS domain-containing protein